MLCFTGRDIILATRQEDTKKEDELLIRATAHNPDDGDIYFNSTLAAVGCANTTEIMECLRQVNATVFSDIWYTATSPLFETFDAYVQQPVGFAIDGEWITTSHYWTEEVASVPLVRFSSSDMALFEEVELIENQISGTVLNEGSLYALTAPNLTDRSYLNSVVSSKFEVSKHGLSELTSLLPTSKLEYYGSRSHDSCGRHLL